MTSSPSVANMAQKLFTETKMMQQEGRLSSFECLLNYKHALYISKHLGRREDEAMIQIHIAKTMNEMGMIDGAIYHCEDAVKLYKQEPVKEGKLTQDAETLLHALKFSGMVSEMVEKMTSKEDCIVLGPIQRLFG